MPPPLPRARGRSRCRRAPLLAAALALVALPATAGDAPASTRMDAAASFFKSGAVQTLRITVPETGLAKWKGNPREYVQCTVVENDKTLYDGVGAKLKGAVGSFRDLDDKPGLTLRFEKFGGDALFHGMEKVYLNNSVQDETYLNEWLASELFRAAGLPAPRVTHARVWLNGRDIGLHVLKEGHDRRFLVRNFEDPEGNLYDGGFCQDIDSELERDEGKGPEDRQDLHELLATCQEPDPARARPLLLARLDVERFLSYMALQRMVGHWDGYCWHRNNYRLYFDRARRGVFVPQGMDVVLVGEEVKAFDEPSSIVGQAVMRDPEWAAAYHRRTADLLPVFLPAERWLRRLDEVAARLRPASAGTTGPAGVDELKARFAARVKRLQVEAKMSAPEPIELAKGQSVKLRSWMPVRGRGAMRLQQSAVGDERVLRWDADPKGDSAGSWRAKVFLAPGRYRVTGAFRADDVVPSGADGKGGLCVRVGREATSERLSGSGPWKTLEVVFEVTDAPRHVEVLLELRASKGTAYGRISSLNLARAAE